VRIPLLNVMYRTDPDVQRSVRNQDRGGNGRDLKRQRDDEGTLVVRAPTVNFGEFQNGCNEEYVPMYMFVDLLEEHKRLKQDVKVMQDYLTKVTSGR